MPPKQAASTSPPLDEKQYKLSMGVHCNPARGSGDKRMASSRQVWASSQILCLKKKNSEANQTDKQYN